MIAREPTHPRHRGIHLVLLGTCGMLAAENPGNGAAGFAPFDGREGEQGVSAEWQRAGADYLDVFRETGEGAWNKILSATPLRKIDGLEGDELGFETGNPVVWSYRTVAENLAFAETSIAADAAGRPAIAYVVKTGETREVRLVKDRGGAWVSEKVATAETSTVRLAFLAGGTPAVAYADADKGLILAEKIGAKGWRESVVAASGEFAMGVSPKGDSSFVFVRRGSAGGHELAWASRESDAWHSELITATKGIPSCLCLAFAPDGTAGVAFMLNEEGECSIRFAIRTEAGWHTEIVSGGYFLPSLAFDGTGVPTIAAADHAKGLRLLTRESGKWQVATVDAAPCGMVTSIARDSNGRPAVLYQDSSGERWTKMRYAAHDGMAWHSGGLWSAGGDSALSLAFGAQGRAMFSTMDEDRRLLRFGTVVDFEQGMRADNDPEKPKARPEEMSMEGEPLDLDMEAIIGEWARPDPTRRGEITILALGADGALSYGFGGAMKSLTPDVSFRYRGTYVFADGVIASRWDKAGNPPFMSDGEGMRMRVVSVTKSHMALEIRPGRTHEVFKRVK